jgi:hypothetical protein
MSKMFYRNGKIKILRTYERLADLINQLQTVLIKILFETVPLLFHLINYKKKKKFKSIVEPN